MNSCMKEHATQKEHDAAREEWFAKRMERQKAREQKAKVAAAQEEFIKDWWGLPEDARLRKKQAAEKQQNQEERVGGLAVKR